VRWWMLRGSRSRMPCSLYPKVPFGIGEGAESGMPNLSHQLFMSSDEAIN